MDSFLYFQKEIAWTYPWEELFEQMEGDRHVALLLAMTWIFVIPIPALAGRNLFR